MAYNDPTLQEIKDRLNIADVISGYIQVKKAGVNFKAACPFHHEKTPSLIISPQKQIWHCFGCGEGGDVFGFVMKCENLEFRDALKILADKAGVKLPSYRPADKNLQDEKDLLLRINDFAARYYHQVLIADRRGSEALQYLEQRGLTRKTIENWQIGYAPDDFHALERALAAKKVSSQDLVKAGVSARNESGQFYDRFRGRITFPIYNYFGETVGFSARLLKDNPNAGKYINSPETIIYNKSRILFGLNFAKDAIRKKDEAVIVEGQMDCIAAHQAGFNNTVALSGTALTEQQLAQLGRLTKNLKFCFDSDSAGQAAARRAGEMALKNGFRLKMIILKNVKDPDELIKKSPGLWEKAVSEAVWFLDYYIDLAKNNYAAGSLEQKHYLSAEVIPFLGFIGDPLEQDHFIRKIVSGFSVSEKVIRGQIKSVSNEKRVVNSGQTLDKSTSPGLLLQKEVLGGLLYFDDFSGRVEAADFEDQQISQLAAAWFASEGKDLKVKDHALAKEALFMLESQLDELEGDAGKFRKSLEKSLALFKIIALKRRQTNLQTQIKAAETAGNREVLQNLNTQFAQILKERGELEKNI